MEGMLYVNLIILMEGRSFSGGLICCSCTGAKRRIDDAASQAVGKADRRLKGHSRGYNNSFN